MQIADAGPRVSAPPPLAHTRHTPVPIATALQDEQPVAPRHYAWLRRVDYAALASTVVFLAWLASATAGTPLATRVDAVFFTPFGLVTAALMVFAGRQSGEVRDRRAWYLLAAACFLRVALGTMWRSATAAGIVMPSWWHWTSLVRVVLEVAALLTFAVRRRTRADRTRLLLDGATVVLGVAVVDLYFVLYPAFFGAWRPATLPGLSGLPEYAVLLTASVCTLLSALLYLRRDEQAIRHAAVCLMIGFGMQAVSDALQWSGSRYEAGSVITAWWWGTWFLKLAAARAALSPSPRREGGDEGRYRSGVVPYVFLAGASVTLWVALSQPDRWTDPWLVLATTALTVLLVVRHLVEQREHARLTDVLQAEEARFGALVQHAYDAVVLMRNDGTATYVSPSTLRFLGDQSSFRVPWGLLKAVHPEDAPALRQLLTAPEHGSVEHACRVRSADGEWHHYALRIVDLRADPRVGTLAIHGHDVTREVHLARRLRETAEVEALGVFAGGLAHDLNNVLGAVSTHVELLLAEAPEGGTVERELLPIQRAIARGTRLTRALLALSRRKEPELEVSDVMEFVRSRGPVGSIVASVGEPVRARMDRAAVGQALDVVLSTETEAGQPRRWRLEVSTCSVEESAAVAADLSPGRYAVIRCECDASAGAASAQLAVGTFAADGGDEALEVLLARAVLREVGGSLHVRDRRSEGACVEFYLPAEAA